MSILFYILFSTSFYFIVSLLFGILYQITKYLNIFIATLITLAPYIYFFLSKSFNQNPFGAIFISILVVQIIGVLFYFFISKINFKEPYRLLLISFGFYIIFQNLISLYFGDDIKTLNTGEITVGHQIFGAYITTVQIITIVVAFIVFVGMYLLYNYSTLGKQIRAVSENTELAAIYGISSNKIILIVTAISSALTAIAGILYAYDTNLTPTMGFNLLLYGIVAMIIGGVGSFRGLLLGSLLLATAQNIVAYYLDTKWMDAVTYVILIGFLVWKPLGFSGKKLRKVEI